MADQLGKADLDQPQYRRAGRGDDGPGYVPQCLRVTAGVIGKEGGPLGGLIYGVKTKPGQSVQNAVNVVHVLELTVKSGVGQGHGVLKLLQTGQRVADRFNGLVGAGADTGAAVDAPLIQDGSLAPPDSDGLGGTGLHTGGAAPASGIFNGDGMLHTQNLLSGKSV